MADIFISYAREDIKAAKQLADALSTQGWSVFWDRTIPVGLSWRSYVGKALEEAGCVMVVWSKSSIESDWVCEEADDGKRRGVLVPVRFDSVLPPIGFRAIQAADLISWDGSEKAGSFLKLVGDIARLLGPPPILEKEEQRKAAEVEAKRRAEADKKRQAEAAAKRKAEEEERERAAAEVKRKAEQDKIRLAQAAATEETSLALNENALEKMSKYGIRCETVDYFHYAGHRYSSLADAVAQAKRGQAPEKCRPGTDTKNLSEMARYGITQSSVDNFYFDKYRYTSLKDAIASAKRSQKLA